MKAITSVYLMDNLFEIVTGTIEARRIAQRIFYLHEPFASDAEVIDFIKSIPYFDIELKNFIRANPLKTYFIDRAWETDFIMRSELWAESDEWIYCDFSNAIASYAEISKGNADFLSLPY